MRAIHILTLLIMTALCSFSAAAITCNSGDLATTCTVSSSQTVNSDVSCNNLVITNSAVLTVDSYNKDGGTGPITIACSGDMTINSGSALNMDGKGYTSGTGPCAGASGGQKIAGSGAGHGGYGGNAWGKSGNRNGAGQC